MDMDAHMVPDMAGEEKQQDDDDEVADMDEMMA